MKVIIQRSLESSVTVNESVVGTIKKGLVLLIGFTNGDTVTDIDYMIKKILNLRIFDDEKGIMNKSILDVGGDVLNISQFTLYANTKKGNRPSYTAALEGTKAEPLYDLFNNKMSSQIHVEKGVFGADMKVRITNDGPITIVLESRNQND